MRAQTIHAKKMNVDLVSVLVPAMDTCTGTRSVRSACAVHAVYFHVRYFGLTRTQFIFVYLVHLFITKTRKYCSQLYRQYKYTQGSSSAANIIYFQVLPQRSSLFGTLDNTIALQECQEVLCSQYDRNWGSHHIKLNLLHHHKLRSNRSVHSAPIVFSFQGISLVHHPICTGNNSV